MKITIARPSPALVLAAVALIVALGGSAYGALGKNTIGTRRLRPKAITTAKLAPGAVTTAKIADRAVTSAKVAPGSLTGSDIDLAALGTVPSATTAASAGNANTVGGHGSSCPAASVLIRGLCFDAAARGPAPSLAAAADACASAGGRLPTPMALYSTRTVLNLGTGVGSDQMYTDSYGPGSTTIVVDGAGTLREQSGGAPARYTCTYPLVR